GILQVQGCTFTANYSGQEGGAIWTYGSGSQTRIINSTFAGNTSVQKGGAISNGADLLSLTQVTIVDNSISGTIGGGLHQYIGQAIAVNTIIARNTANNTPSDVVSFFTTLDTANSFNNLIGNDPGGSAGSGL